MKKCLRQGDSVKSCSLYETVVTEATFRAGDWKSKPGTRMSDFEGVLRAFHHMTAKTMYLYMFWVFLCVAEALNLVFLPVRLVVVSLSRSNVSLPSKITSGEILKLPTRNVAAASVWNAENSSAYRKAASGRNGWFLSSWSRLDWC